ncbi:MAG: sialidase [Planctomycetes bacterium DG_23]|nr:MAG: sialidase [Planctomycetes bacterium DG_23]
MGKHLNYEVELTVAHSGYDGITCWVHARAGIVPGAGNAGQPAVIMTSNKLLLSGSDVFYGVSDMRTDDLGASWTIPRRHASLSRRKGPKGSGALAHDFTPKWHAATGRLLNIGTVAHYTDDRGPARGFRSWPAYTIYDQAGRTWTRWETVEMPDDEKFSFTSAGSTQRGDLADGTILLPITFRPTSQEKRPISTATVMRASFDGSTLRYIEHGSELSIDIPRGFNEPSLAYYDGRYFLTLRNDEAGYVTSGEDGLHFDPPRKWKFDDGEDLGNYNTQQHWATHSEGTFLVYTRRGANNDHIFRHRAPLFMAEVDPERLQVIRETERVLVPERGARLGNFGVADISENQTWVTVTEWMQPVGCSRYGSDNSIFVAKIHWEKPNRLFQA